ncbi:MAG: hypothetical protein NTY68_02150 [Candidatus Micrarchaeota archaeon]|nr:hypothetical protein [Candidatus Micrarchaeota archaeon]
MNLLASRPGQTLMKQNAKAREPLVESSPKTKKATMDDFWIGQGWYRKMKDGSKKLRTGKWKGDPEARIAAVRFLVEEVLRKDPRDIDKYDFHLNRLGGLLGRHYEDSPYGALKEAGYDHKPWEMSWAPRGFYESKDNRVSAIRWLVERLKKDPQDIEKKDFISNRLSGLLQHYRSSPYEALLEAGFVASAGRPYLRHRARIRDNFKCIVPVNASSNGSQASMADFWIRHGWYIPIEEGKAKLTYAKWSQGADIRKEAVLALKEAGYRLRPWKMHKTPNGFFESRENRIEAIKRLVEKLKKNPRDVIKRDFYSNSLSGLISHHYRNSSYLALLEAGLVTKRDEPYMRNPRHTHKDSQ